jgi:glycosyltransferase involved in cell wall biosynthesis
MAGPGIRAFELARALARRHEVVLAVPNGSSSLGYGPEPVIYDEREPATLRRLVRGAVVFAPPLAPALLGRTPQGWVVDLYNPEPFEGLHTTGRYPARERRVRDTLRIDRLLFAARTGTSFVCASERQRDMWLGFLAAARRLRSQDHAEDPELKSLIDVVPFGVPDEPPTPSGPRLRGSVLPDDAKIMIWNGGLWDWLDPELVIRAFAILHREDPAWRLVLSGIGRPSERPVHRAAERTLDLAREAGPEVEDAIHHREWTPYAERAGQLLDADVGVSIHRLGLESRFAHRARILDLLWGGVPILCTAGDEWSLRIERESLGEVVAPDDPTALANGARTIVDRGRDAYAEPIARAAAAQTWTKVAEPLDRLVEAAESTPRSSRDIVAKALAFRHRTAALATRLRRR